MKILFAAAGYKPAFRMGGPIHSISALAETLVHKGHEVVVFATNSNISEDLDVPTDRPVDVDGVEVWYFQHQEPLRRWLPFVPYLSKSSGFFYAASMKTELKRMLPTVDVVHTQAPFVYGTYASGKAAIRHAVPLFYSQRGVFSASHLRFRGLKKRLYIAAVERPIMRQATTLVALTRDEKDSFRTLKVQTPCRIIPNGVHVPERKTPAAGLDGLGEIRPEDQVILFMARLHPIKGADMLLRAFAALCRANPRAKLVMAGPDEWGLVEGFRQELQAGGVADRVLFPGLVTGALKESLLDRADLFCLPSHAEGFSMAVLEALAHETAVLLSPDCHFPEVEAAGAGRVVSIEPDALCRAMKDLLADPAGMKEMGRKGRALVERSYSWDTIVDQLLDVYREGLERSRRGRP